MFKANQSDHRTGLKIADVQKVMDGGIDPFIEAFLKETGGEGAGLVDAEAGS